MTRPMETRKQCTYVFWDNSNIFLAGREYAENTEGPAFAAGMRIQFTHLLRLALAGRQAGKIICVGSDFADLAAMWQKLRDTGTEVEIFEPGNSSRREQGVDQCLQVHMLRAALDVQPPGVAVLLTGDGAGFNDGTGFHADLKRLHVKGWGVEVLSWTHSCGRSLRSWAESAGVFVPIERYYKSVTFVTGLRYASPLSLKNRAMAQPSTPVA